MSTVKDNHFSILHVRREIVLHEKRKCICAISEYLLKRSQLLRKELDRTFPYVSTLCSPVIIKNNIGTDRSVFVRMSRCVCVVEYENYHKAHNNNDAKPDINRDLIHLIRARSVHQRLRLSAHGNKRRAHDPEKYRNNRKEFLLRDKTKCTVDSKYGKRICLVDPVDAKDHRNKCGRGDHISAESCLRPE